MKYKDITWGKRLNKKLGHYTFYPIYDWTYLDVWKAIHDHGWSYNTVYDAMFRYGVPDEPMAGTDYEQAMNDAGQDRASKLVDVPCPNCGYKLTLDKDEIARKSSLRRVDGND